MENDRGGRKWVEYSDGQSGLGIEEAIVLGKRRPGHATHHHHEHHECQSTWAPSVDGFGRWVLPVWGWAPLEQNDERIWGKAKKIVTSMPLE
ncbi:uncharacterized protein G2W53_019676 [Senna tora]|uniref:Uncharacterized protein n=1 Tax=Senna tora TaxID=362788 RepID=A0A834TUH5_9FABA|nr:uncharacterized protein G2W53_019676 [Senna tora]